MLEAVNKMLDLRPRLFIELIALARWHPHHRARADGDDFFCLRADLFEFVHVLLRSDGALHESDVHLVHDVVGLQHARMAEVYELFPFLPVVVQKLGHHDRGILTAGKREPADAKFFSCRLFCHSYACVKAARLKAGSPSSCSFPDTFTSRSMIFEIEPSSCVLLMSVAPISSPSFTKSRA